MVKQAKRPPRKPKELPADAKLRYLEVDTRDQSYHMYANFVGKDSDWDVELRVSRRTDLGKAITTIGDAIRTHPKRKV